MTNASGDKSGLDIGREPIGEVYAKALIGAMEQLGKTDLVLDELESLVFDVLDKFPNLEAALSSPRIAHDAKAGTLTRVFQSRMSGELLTFLKVLSSHGRLDCLRAIQRAARRLENQMRGRIEVRVTTTAAADAALTQQISQVLRVALDSDIDMASETDPDLIGGMVVRVGDTMYDASVANELSRLRDEAVEKTALEIQHALARFSEE